MSEKMTVTCQKCGMQRESNFELMNKTECSNCGIHGKITTSNSRTIRLPSGETAFVPNN